MQYQKNQFLNFLPNTPLRDHCVLEFGNSCRQELLVAFIGCHGCAAREHPGELSQAWTFLNRQWKLSGLCAIKLNWSFNWDVDSALILAVWVNCKQWKQVDLVRHYWCTYTWHRLIIFSVSSCASWTQSDRKDRNYLMEWKQDTNERCLILWRHAILFVGLFAHQFVWESKQVSSVQLWNT